MLHKVMELTLYNKDNKKKIKLPEVYCPDIGQAVAQAVVFMLNDLTLS